MDVIIDPCWDLSQSMLVKGAPSDIIQNGWCLITTVYEPHTNLVITVPADVLAPLDAIATAGTVMNTKLYMFYL